MSPELSKLLFEAKAQVDVMSSEEVAEMLSKQGESLARNYKPGPRQARIARD